MFDSTKNLTARMTDAVDLMIDFATLGEYGLEEPAGRTTRACEADRAGRGDESFYEALFPNQCGTRTRTLGSSFPKSPAVRAGMRRGSEAFG
jgi:hypothetical protein